MLDKSDLQAIAELMDLKLEPIKEQLAEVRDVATRASIIQVIDTLPNIQLMYESNKSIIEEHKRLDKIEAKIEVLQDDVFALKETVKQLKKAQ